jgi:hypothetical protein
MALIGVAFRELDRFGVVVDIELNDWSVCGNWFKKAGTWPGMSACIQWPTDKPDLPFLGPIWAS